MANYKDVKKIQIGNDIYELGIPEHGHPEYSPDGNDNQTVVIDGVSFEANDPVKIVEGTNISITANKDQKTATISVSGLATVATTGSYSDLANKPDLATFGGVPTSRTINGHSLAADITLTAEDVEALPVGTPIPAPANNAIIRIAAATTGATGTIFGDFTTNQSTDETISIPVASTTNAGLMSSQDKVLLTNMQDMYAEWAENNRPKLSIASFNVVGSYSSATTSVTTNSVALLDGFTFTAASLTWSLNNTDDFQKIVFNVDGSTSTVTSKTATTHDITDKTFSIGKNGTIAQASAYENSSTSARSTKTVSISSTYVVRYGYSANASETLLATVSTKNTTSKNTTITGLTANNQFIYVFLPKNLYNYENLATAQSKLKFFLDGSLLEGGMTVESLNSSAYANTHNGVASEKLPYWVCRSSNKLTTNSTFKIEIKE